MVERDKERLITFQCDECSETFETDTDDFNIAIIMVQEANWYYQGNNRHRCGSCEQYMKDF